MWITFIPFSFLFLHKLSNSQGCNGTWKTWKRGNFLIKSGKTLKSQGKKLKKHRSQGKVREKSGNVFVSYVCFSGMHKIASSDQNFRGHCFAYLLDLLSTLLRREFSWIVREMSGNFVLDFLWQPYQSFFFFKILSKNNLTYHSKQMWNKSCE